jgi:DNA-binding beta-propeller fold protein YncE
MKHLAKLIAASLLLSTAAMGQAFLPQQPEPPGPVKIPDAPQLPYHFSDQITGAHGEQFGNVAAVAIRPNGNLLVFNRNPNIMMVEYDPTGTKLLRVFNPNIAMNPHALRVDRYGNIWVSDSFLNVIYKLDPNGNVIRSFGVRGENAKWDDSKWNGMFNQPLDIAWDKDDNIYVVQSHGGTSPPADCSFCATYDLPATRNAKVRGVFVHPPVIPGSDPRVMKFDKDGNLLASASLAHADGLLPVIHSVVVTPSGDVWVGDRASTKIVVFDKDLKHKSDIQVGNLTCGFYVDAKGQLWMSTGRHGMVLKMGWDGKVQGWFGKHGDVRDSHDVGEGHYMAVSRDQKYIFMADSVLAKVHRIERN